MQYPNDILVAAERALDNLLCNCAESCGGVAGVRDASIKDIAKALAAEREACASDLDSLAEMATMMGDKSAWRALRSAADAIRNRSN